MQRSWGGRCYGAPTPRSEEEVRPMRPWKAIAVFLVAIVSVASCGSCSTGGGGGAATSSPAASASSSAPASEPAASPSEIAAASAACNPPKQDGVTLSFVSFGGVYQEAQRKAWLTPYTTATGVQFTEDENSSNATIK